MDFARYMCHNTGQHHLAAGPSPAHNNGMHSDGGKVLSASPTRVMPSISPSVHDGGLYFWLDMLSKYAIIYKRE